MVCDQDPDAEEQRDRGQQQPEQAGDAQRRHRERSQPLDRQADQRPHAPRRHAVRALRRLVIDARLAESDPARQSLEEAAALRHLPQRRRRARRQQAEIAGILGDFLPRAQIDQRVEPMHAGAAQPGLVLAVRLGGVDHVVAVIEPARDQRLDQIGRMLAVAVHEQHGAEPGVIETGEQRGLLAEIARQRDHLHVERIGDERMGDLAGGVGAAVVDVDDFGAQPARGLEPARHGGDALVQGGEALGLVEYRHDDRQAGRGRRSRRGGAGFARFRRHLSVDLLVSGRSIAHATRPVAPASKCYEPSMIPASLRNLLDRLTAAWHERAVALKAISFALVGLVNSVVDFSVFSFAYYYLALADRRRQRAGLGRRRHRLYVLNSTITFAHESGRKLSAKSYFNFALSQVAGFLANTGTVWCLVELLPRAGLGRQGGGDRGQLRGQFLAVAFRGVPHARSARRKLSWSVNATRQQSDGALAELRHPSRMRHDRRAARGRSDPQSFARGQAAAGALRSCRRRQSAEQGQASPPARPICGATANCCRCAIRPTSSAWAKRSRR